jgi:hypothetical protein
VCSGLALGIFALIFFDRFSSRSRPNPLPQPLHELRQANGAHPYQSAVERLECATTWKPPRPMGLSAATLKQHMAADPALSVKAPR